jgi:hypothetical protein
VGELPVTSVWLTCQQPARDQRRGRYVPDTTRHPAKMLPALAAHAVATYTRPGDLVLDPMCGAGTSLVEAVRAGRHGIGVDIEQNFVDLPRPTSTSRGVKVRPGKGWWCAATPPTCPGCCPAACAAQSTSCSPHRRTGNAPTAS